MNRRDNVRLRFLAEQARSAAAAADATRTRDHLGQLLQMLERVLGGGGRGVEVT